MSKRVSNSFRRKKAILERAIKGFCSVNHKWCFAHSKEQAIKDLLRDGYIYFTRESDGDHKRITRVNVTESGLEYMKYHKMNISLTSPWWENV